MRKRFVLPMAGRLPSWAQDTLLATALVLLAAGFAWLVSQTGDRRLSMIFMLPVVFSGVLGGRRAGVIAATLSYLAYDLFVVPPYLRLFAPNTTKDGVALAVFATAALGVGLGSGAMREEQRREAERSRTILRLLETHGFFAVTPNPAAIGERLTAEVAALAGTGALLVDADGRVLERAGQAAQWVGGLEGDLADLARFTMRREGLAVRGRFHAVAMRTGEATFGAVVWPMSTKGSRENREQVQHIVMLIDLAAEAMARARGKARTPRKTAVNEPA